MSTPQERPFAPAGSSVDPLRILVMGASTVTWLSWMGGPRSDYAFPRALEVTLNQRGVSATVHNRARLGTPVRDFFTTWEEDVLQWSPDVIIAVIGHYEVLHVILPRWFERWANRVDIAPGPIRSRARQLVRGCWMQLAKVQGLVDRYTPTRFIRPRIMRVVRDTEAYVRLCQWVGSPKIILVGLMDTDDSKKAWFPGMGERIDLLNKSIRELVARLGLPHVTYWSPHSLVDQMYGGDCNLATPDGFHYTPALHRAVAEQLADVILSS